MLCLTCGGKSNLRCPCHKAIYCSRKCQKNGWPAHKSSCEAKVKKTVVPLGGLPGTNEERTFIAIKPDGVQRGMVSEIIGRFEDRGFKLVAMKQVTPSLEQAQGHYADLSSKGFFNGLCTYFSSGPIVAMCWEGFNVILTGRDILGATNPQDSAPGTIRGDCSVEVGRNICHGSDAPESAQRELNFWFTAEEFCNWGNCTASWVYEKPVDCSRGTKAEKKVTAQTKDGQLPVEGIPGTNQERTFIAIKPDGVERRKISDVMSRFEARGFKLAGLKMVWPSAEKAAGHYDDLKTKKFFPGLVKYFSSGPIVAMCWEGREAIATGRVLLGATNPEDALPGTIRGDLCIDIGRNVCHGSDGVDSAAHELKFWFHSSEVNDWENSSGSWLYE